MSKIPVHFVNIGRGGDSGYCCSSNGGGYG
jgi:hypothetical protein